MTPSIALLVFSWVILTRPAVLQAQIPAADAHDHMAGPCPYIPKEKRPEFGCWRVATSRDLKFSQPMIYWHLRTFTSRRPQMPPRVRPGLLSKKTDEFGSQNSDQRRSLCAAVT